MRLFDKALLRNLFSSGVLLSLLLGLSACQMFSSSDQPVVDPNSLEAIAPQAISPALLDRPPIELGIDQVIVSYTQLLPLLQRPEEKLRVLHRLADLKLKRGEALMVEEAVDELDIAISAYQGLLELYPEREVNDQILYQLAKSYDLQGKSEQSLLTLTTLIESYPQTQYASEVQFRRGEILFTNADYEAAERAFSAVVNLGDQDFLANAHYMKGWSQFKQTRYAVALTEYAQVLDLVLPQPANLEQIDAKYRTMVDDLFRVMSLSFSYLGGAEAVEDLFKVVGPRDYEDLVYARFGEHLITKELYTDAIAVYEGFIARHPLHLSAPRFQIRIIETLYRADFKQDILEQKIRFVDEYGLGSAFWSENQTQDLGFVYEQLEALIPELADRFYILAQQDKNLKSKARQSNYRKASYYYESFVATFPEHPMVANNLFLLGESYFALENWPAAIVSYEAAGFDYPQYEKAAESAYASVVTYTRYAKQWDVLTPELQMEKRDEQQENRLRFVNMHSDDERADDVLYVSAQYAFAEKRYAQTIEMSDRLLAWLPLIPANVRVEARILKAHSLYALQDFVLAEQAYQQALEILPAKDARRTALIENLAASVYQQAEGHLAAGNKAAAIEELLRIAVVAPGAALRANAEYDAISYLIELKQWPRAISQITLFRAQYPQHELMNTLVPKMALSYRETSQWELAADELKTMIALAKTDEEKRDTLFIAAELYDRASNWDKAIKTYRSYANTYAKPADVYMEAANRLAELYEKTGDPLKRRFWLAKQMKTVDALGAAADDRMVYLAASASAVLAEDAFQQYKRIKLKLPLNVSMEKKTVALEKAMKAYQKTASYGISSFATEAGYRMADIYAQLSRDLMDSDRPAGLNALELEQYEILLEEQAFPFEDSAIEIHEQNASRSWNGIYDDWVKQSFDSLKRLLPGRYDKPELETEVSNVLD